MKKVLLCIYIISVLIIWTTSTIITYKKYSIQTIPDNYIAVFIGDNYNTTNTTYVYKITKKKKVSYKYVNTKSIINNYDSAEYKETITSSGKAKNVKELIKKAKKHKADSYVKYIEDDNIYTLEEIKEVLE